MQSLLGLSIISCVLMTTVSVNSQIRSDFHKDNHEEEDLKKIINHTEYHNSPLTKAYKGLSETMMAQYAFMPTSKLRYFNNGKYKIESAIKTEPDNPELRYIRLMVQLNAPSLLGYTKEVSDDLTFFIINAPKFALDKKWTLLFTDNLLKTKYIKPEQKSRLLKLRKQLT